MGRVSKVSRRRKTRRTRRVRRQRGGNQTKSSPFFQKAYAITLDPEGKRYKDIKAYTDAAQIPLEPWKGVVIKPDQVSTLPEQGIGTTNFKDRTLKLFNMGVIGAYLAHRNLFQHIAANEADKPGTLIFEDDVEIPPDFYEKLAVAEKDIPADWDFIFLDKLYVDGTPISNHVMKLKKDMTATKNWGIWAYIVKNSSLKDRILPKLEHMIDVPDIQLAKHADVLNMYMIQPQIVRQDRHNAPNSVVTMFDTAAANQNAK